MDALKKLLEVVGGLLPAQVVFDGGGAGVFVIVVVSALAIVWKALISKLPIPSNGALAAVALGLPILACLHQGRPWTALIFAVLALVVAILHWRGVRLRPAGFVVVFLVVLVSSLVVEGRIIKHRRDANDERITVYVVLPFQPTAGEDLGTLLSLSKTVRDTVSGIYGSLADVRVKPSGFKEVGDLEDWKELPAVVERLRAEGFPPDVVLVNSGMLFDEPADQRFGRPAEQYFRFVLWPRFRVPAGERFDERDPITVTGRRLDVEYLAIRASVALLAQMQQGTKPALSADDEATVLRNAVTAYHRRLMKGECPSEACTAAKRVLGQPALALHEVSALTESYPPDMGDYLNATRGERARSVVDMLSLRESHAGKGPADASAQGAETEGTATAGPTQSAPTSPPPRPAPPAAPAPAPTTATVVGR